MLIRRWTYLRLLIKTLRFRLIAPILFHLHLRLRLRLMLCIVFFLCLGQANFVVHNGHFGLSDKPRINSIRKQWMAKLINELAEPRRSFKDLALLYTHTFTYSLGGMKLLKWKSTHDEQIISKKSHR